MRMARLLLVIVCLYALGAFTVLMAGYLDRWPRTRERVIQLGQAACNFALGLMALAFVVVLLRSFGILPPQAVR